MEKFDLGTKFIAEDWKERPISDTFPDILICLKYPLKHMSLQSDTSAIDFLNQTLMDEVTPLIEVQVEGFARFVIALENHEFNR